MNKFSIQTSFAISAGAGSGKTYTLSRRFINILLGFDFFIEAAVQDHFYENRESKCANLREIVTITYTEAAALEMKERIFGLIHKILYVDKLAEKDGDLESIRLAYKGLNEDAAVWVHQRLNTAMREMSEANITTIHGFCLGVLKRHADVAKIDGALDVYGDEDKKQLFKKVYFEIVKDEAYQDEILSITKYVSLYKSLTLIERYVFEHKFRQAFDHYVHGYNEAIKEILINTFVEPLSDLIDKAYEELKADPKLPILERYLKKIYAFEFETFSECAEILELGKVTLGKKTSAMTELRDTFDKTLGGYFKNVDGEKEEQFIQTIERFKRLLGVIKARYDDAMRLEGVTDFDTIIQQAAAIMEKINTSYRYIMVDEFQDTNALQWEIVKSAGRDANLFVVGDEKQSIYAFQGGEIEVFHTAIRERFATKEGMRENFRSDQSIIQFINLIFKSIFEPTDAKGSNRQIFNDYEAAYQDLKSMSKEHGNVSFLVSRIDKKDEEGEGEADNMALFIKNIVEGHIYPDIAEKITANKPAIAVVYDAKSKMLDLKSALYELGIECKVSASENFYAKEEISDIFFVLKALTILRKQPLWDDLSKTQKFHIAGALRSKIFRWNDKEVHDLFDIKKDSDIFKLWCERSFVIAPHLLIQELLSENNVYAVYAQLENYDQRLANIQKIISDIISYESSHGYDLDSYVYMLEQNIFHAETDEDEAFYRSTTGGSIELCSIHSTKGLAYPMVIVVDSGKSLTSQVTSESIKFNTFKDTRNDRYNLIGFKIGNYEPLSLRLLKEVDKRKHMAEKKRLYYVALTRAQNHLVISANLKMTDKGVGNIHNSYLQMTFDAIGMNKEDIFERNIGETPYTFYYADDLKVYEPVNIEKTFEKVSPLAPWKFESRSDRSATVSDEANLVKSPELERVALRGTLVHKALELFWDHLDDDDCFERLFHKEGIDDITLQEDVKRLSRNFKNTPIYGILRSGAQHLFEYHFDEYIAGVRCIGSIDMVYFDNKRDGWVIVDFKSGQERENHGYDSQLDFYRRVLESKNLNVLDAQLCWLG
jgi:ATP-dependent exoDNAse (exonuclease V) beta subunit